MMTPRLPPPNKIVHIATIDASVRVLLLNQLLYLERAGFDVSALSSAGPNVPMIQAAGVRHISVEMSRNFTPLRDLTALWHLYRVMRREGFTLVHTHTPKPGLLGQIAARMAGVPIVVNTVHGFYFHENTAPSRRRFYIAIEKIAARCSSLILSQNAEDIETAVQEGICARDKIRFLGNGIDLSRFNPSSVNPVSVRRLRAELGIQERAPVVGFVGRLVREKGLLELFEAARIVRARIPEVRFLLVGRADIAKADAVTAEAADDYDIEGVCCFAGAREDMPDVYSLMNVLVLPSHREGFPRTPMEAAAMGVPSIVTDVRGCREVVVHGETGLTVPVHDATALADAILSTLLDGDLASRLGRAARARAAQHFDERVIFERVTAHYRDLLSARGLEAPTSRLAS